VSLDLKPDRVDTLADLPSATADAIRAELREGERVAYAAVPVTALDAGTWGGMGVKSMVVGAIIACGFALFGSIAVFIAGELRVHELIMGIFIPTCWLGMAWVFIWYLRLARRIAAAGAYVVTDQRVILLETWPARAMSACESRDITEVYCWMISPKFGNIRLNGKATLDRTESRWYLPHPRACEAAVRELLARSIGR
jgi:hypothetical protein